MRPGVASRRRGVASVIAIGSFICPRVRHTCTLLDKRNLHKPQSQTLERLPHPHPRRRRLESARGAPPRAPRRPPAHSAAEIVDDAKRQLGALERADR
mmetsp:Transcript_27368/g.93149  ORF Transcript_27368/g.93149 Transcript_27368/m.93149 type:complete len:98 (+) Transcript_27368:717-1010(+)